MKKIWIFLTLILSLVPMGCKKEKKAKIVVAEVTHSVFYAPQYVALSQGIFQKYGLNVEIILASGADKVMSSLLSKDADIGLLGPEASIYVYKGGRSDYAISFAQLTQKDGSFIVAREDIKDFKLTDLVGKEILGGRRGGMPLMTLTYILNQNNLNPELDNQNANINVRTDIAFSAMAGSFMQGEGDFTTLFEPTASEVSLAKKGYVVSSVGKWTDNVAYTCYQALKSYMDNNEETLIAFTKAIAEAMKWVYEHTDHEVAAAVRPYFTETKQNILESAIRRYRELAAWSPDPYLDEEEFKHLQDIIIASNELDSYVPYAKLVKNLYSKGA